GPAIPAGFSRLSQEQTGRSRPGNQAHRIRRLLAHQIHSTAPYPSTPAAPTRAVRGAMASAPAIPKPAAHITPPMTADPTTAGARAARYSRIRSPISRFTTVWNARVDVTAYSATATATANGVPQPARPPATNPASSSART